MRNSQTNSVYYPLSNNYSALLKSTRNYWEAAFQVNLCQGMTTERYHLTGGLEHLLFEIYRSYGGILEVGMSEEAGIKIKHF